MTIAGHVWRAMLSRYSPVRMEAKRCALDKIGAPQIAADENRQKKQNDSSGIRWLLSQRSFSNRPAGKREPQDYRFRL